MKFKNIQKWKITDEIGGLLYFAQRSEELLFDFTLDSYKPPTLNPPGLVTEALTVLREIELKHLDPKNLDHVIQELSWTISKDPVAKSLIDVPTEKYLIKCDPENLKPLRIRLEVLERTLDPLRYYDRCSDLLFKAIKDQKKNRIDTLARLFFSTLINLGMHKAHLYHLTNGFFFFGSSPESITDASAFKDFEKAIHPYSHKFEVFFIASDLIADVSTSLKVFEIKIHEDLPEPLQAFAKENGFTLTEYERIVEVGKIRALDCHSAREDAEVQLDRLRDFFTLFHHKNQISWKEETLISQCCDDTLRIVRLPRNSMEKGEDLKPAVASERLNQMLKRLRLSPPEMGRLARAVDFHGLSVTNSDPENQLLSLWIALETLSPSDSTRSKIAAIVEGVIPFLTMNYLGRQFRYLARDLVRWNRFEMKKIYHDLGAPNDFNLPMKTFLLVALEANKDLREHLYSELRDFHLLRHRIHTLSHSIASPKKMQKYIENHEQRTSWQIRRIYRTRNLIVHSGATPANISSLIENGHDYLDQVLLTITRMSSSNYRVRSLAQAFELASVARSKIFTILAGDEAYEPDNMRTLLNEHDFVRGRDV